MTDFPAVYIIPCTVSAALLLGDGPTPLLPLQVYSPSWSALTVESMVSTDKTVKLAPGVSSVVKLAEGPVQEMVGTGLPCAVQLNAAGLDWFTVMSTGGTLMKGWAGCDGELGGEY